MRYVIMLGFLATIGTVVYGYTYPPATVPPKIPLVTHTEAAARAITPATKGEPVPDNLKPPTLAYFRKLFVLPDTVIWKFDYTKQYPLGGITVCGRVNFQNSNRVYGGELPFYAIFQEGRIIDGGVAGSIVDDPTGTTADSRLRFCEKA